MVRENHLLVPLHAKNQTTNTWQTFLNYEISEVTQFTGIKH